MTPWSEANRARRLAYYREYYMANHAHLRAKARSRRSALPELFLLTNAKSRAKEMGMPFDLTVDDIHIPARCPVLGVVLDTQPGRRAYDHGTAATLDRLEPARGYVRGNVAVISLRANRMKNDGTADEHEKIALWMRQEMERAS